MAEPFIKIENLCYEYTDADGVSSPAVKNISFSVMRGEYIAVLGHNGSGKSTLAKLLNMILTPTSGKIFIDGRDITADDITEDDMFDIRRRVGMVFQNPDNQLVATIVEEDVAFGPENLGVPSAEIRKRVDDALDTVGMREYARHEPHRLSGGQKQRIAIAGIIAMLPECIIFDESTAMLDPIGRREVMDTIEQLNKKGITIIHITHYMDEAVRANRVIVINDGEIYRDGMPAEIFSDVAALRRVGLDVPQSTELLYELTQLGIPFEPGCIDADECARLIIARYSDR